jgi:hypothetical protein
MVAGRCAEARLLIDEALALGRAAQADYWVLRSLVYRPRSSLPTVMSTSFRRSLVAPHSKPADDAQPRDETVGDEK